MKFKILFSALIVIVTLVISTIVVLASITSKTEFIETDPEIIYIYKSNITADTTITKNDAKYKKILNEFSKISQISMFNEILRGKHISKYPIVNTSSEVWQENNKSSGIYIEFVYTNLQKLIVLENNNTRIIEVKAIIFRLSESDKLENVNMFYRSGENYITTDTYGEPIHSINIEANTSKLYKLI